MPRYRLLIVASHPIQYQAPMHRTLAMHPAIDLNVLFCSDWGLKSYFDRGFGCELHWDIPLLDGYYSAFLRNRSCFPNLHGFGGLVNPGVVHWIVSGRYDAILVNGWAHATYWLAMVAAAATRTPLLLRGETNLLNHISPMKKALKNAALRPLFAATSGFLSIGRYNTEFYQSWGVPSRKIYHAPYSVDNAYWLRKAAEFKPLRQQLKRDHGLDPEASIVLFSGKLIGTKRPFDLLRAFEHIKNQTRVGLVFVGDGELRRYLEGYARERGITNVRFLGFKNQTELAPVFAMADIFVLPSGFEPWGLVVNEALCFGLPVIASDRVGSAGDLVKPGVNGLTYPAGDVDALTKCLEELVLNTSFRERASEASGKLIQTWSYSQVVDGVLECLHSVCKKQEITFHAEVAS